ncbi:hypothetical protein V3391_06635 [Luteimonas sp. SMYT11W]|uniref:Uncharacterized protein n=1 Tax=Luteimonas flava TaxID=3115822 RepID=A0ABU7WDD3_9GAMM
MSEAIREYRRELAVYCMTRTAAPVTAAELAETMESVAHSEGHPKACYAQLTGVEANGILVSLRRAGAVRIIDTVRDSAQGRDVNKWVAADGAERAPLPLPPDPSTPETHGVQLADQAGIVVDPRMSAILQAGEVMARFEAAQRARREAFERESIRLHAGVQEEVRALLEKAGMQAGAL